MSDEPITPDTERIGTVLVDGFAEEVNRYGGVPRFILDDMIAAIDGDDRVATWPAHYRTLLLDLTEGLTADHVRAAAAAGFGLGLPVVGT